MVIDGLAQSLGFAVVYAFPRQMLHKEIIPVILMPPPFNHAFLVLPPRRVFLAPFRQARLIWCTPVDSRLPSVSPPPSNYPI